MKRCPTCQSTYTDDSLNFCLQDGTTLLRVEDAPPARSSDATWVMPVESSKSRDAPTEAFNSGGAPTLHLPPTSPTVQEFARKTARDAHISAPTPQKRTSPALVAGVTAIVVLLLALVGIGVALLMRGPDTPTKPEQQGEVNTNNPPNKTSSPAAKTDTGAATPTPTYEPPARTSLKMTATASSTRVPMKAFTYEPAHALDGSLLTAWIEGVPGPGVGEWLRCDFDREVKLNQIIFTPGYFKNPSIWKQNNRLAAATFHFSDGTSRRFTFPDRMQEQRLDAGGVRTRFVRLVIDEIYPGSVDSEDTAISQISFDWEP